MTLSKEWLDCKLSDCERYHHAHQAPIRVKELRDVIRELLALLALRERAEPVAWRYPYAKPGFELGWVMVEDEALCNRSANYQIEPLYTAPPAPVVPDELLTAMEEVLRISDRQHDAWDKAKAAVSACRAAMQGKAEPVSNPYKLPDGWVLVPIEPTWDMLSADGCSKHHGGQECSHHENRKRIWRAMLAAAPAPGKEG